MYPDFLCIGAQKAGTTWLYRNLKNHPRIWMPEVKELHYFDEKIKLEGGVLARLRGDRVGDKRWRRQARSRLRRYPGDLTLANLAWDLRYFFGRPRDEWYAALFEPGGGRITGETTPDYSVLDVEAISHVHDLMPEAKIVFMMRNPIERLWSAADMRFRGRGQSLQTATEEELSRRFDLERVRLLTDYLRTLENWQSVYPKDQIFVGFLEDVHLFPEELLRRLYGFLGVDRSLEYRVISEKIHAGSSSQIPAGVAARLAREHYDAIERLHERFGGYASFWLYCADRLIDDTPPGGVVPYPLWESPMWEGWVEERGDPRPQSGVLSSVEAAKGRRGDAPNLRAEPDV